MAAKRGNRPQQIAQLLAENASHEACYSGARLPVAAINVLAQPRKTFEHLEELGLDIAKKRLLSPPIVAKFDRGACERYIAVVNSLWGTAYAIGALRRQGGAYHVLLAGERRFRSCKLLWEKGCTECIERHGRERPGRCFRRHLGDAIEVRLCANIPPLAALFLQLSENTHMPVPAHEEAKAYALLFGLIRTAEPTYPMAKFAREVGRSADTIKRALRFHSLPAAVKDEVESGRIAYGLAVEIARLHEAGVGEEILQLWLKRALVERKNVDDFRKAVTARLEEMQSGQETLLGLFSHQQEVDSLRRHVRRTVSANMVHAVWTWVGYMSRLVSLLEEGRVGAQREYSEESPRRVLASLVGYLRRGLPLMQPFLRDDQAEEFRAVIVRAEQFLATTHTSSA